MIEVRNLIKKFGKKTALDDICLKFDTGVYGMLGPNGAGKTTLMRSIVGLYKVHRGDILFRDKSIKKYVGFTKDIGYLPQKFGLFKELSVYDMMAYMATLKGIEKSAQKEQIEKCVEQVNLSGRIKDKIRSLSGGMIRRLGIAQALLGDPSVIIVDEPTAGLDPEERARFKNLIALIKQNRTIIISTHIVEDVEAICSDIVIMDKGKIKFHGDSKSICEIAQGKVFSVPAGNESDLAGDYFVLKREQSDGEPMLRVLSNTKQAGSSAKPTIEDGYMCKIKGI